VEYSRAVESRVTFNALTEDELRWYLETGEPYDKAGAYAVQGKAAAFIKELRGSHTNVIGLPLSEVVEALRKTGAMKLC
jgi:septum formation protein